jgi:hypothetical protein
MTGVCLSRDCIHLTTVRLLKWLPWKKDLNDEFLKQYSQGADYIPNLLKFFGFA